MKLSAKQQQQQFKYS